MPDSNRVALVQPIIVVVVCSCPIYVHCVNKRQKERGSSGEKGPLAVFVGADLGQPGKTIEVALQWTTSTWKNGLTGLGNGLVLAAAVTTVGMVEGVPSN